MRRLLIVVPPLLMLCACVSMKAPSRAATTKSQSVARRNHQVQAITRWSVSGALSMKTPTKGYLLNYRWQQKQNQYWLDVSSALNAYGFKLYGRPGYVELTSDHEAPIHAKSAAALLEKMTQWHLPVDPLSFWLRALPDPSHPFNSQLNPFGLYREIIQDGWRIEYLSYQAVNGVNWPKLMRISRNNLQIKMVMKHWTLE